MLKKFLIGMGILFSGLFAVAAVSLAIGGANAVRDAPVNKAVAEAMLRDIAREWDPHTLQPMFAPVAARQVAFSNLQTTMNKLRPLGRLSSIERAEQTGWQYTSTLGVAIEKRATIEFVAAFENGRANVKIELRNVGGEMKLWHMDVNSTGPVRSQQHA